MGGRALGMESDRSWIKGPFKGNENVPKLDYVYGYTTRHIKKH